MTTTYLSGDAIEQLKNLQDESVHMCCCSPPYWGQRDYAVHGQLGKEPTKEEYIENIVQVFREVKRVLRNDGTLWVNLGDSYAGSGKTGGKSYPQKTDNLAARNGSDAPIHSGLKPKNLIGMPWRVALALQDDGWILRSDIIWAKSNGMPEPVKDRPSKSHEYIFLFSKKSKYYYDADAVRIPHTDKSKVNRGNGEPKTNTWNREPRKHLNGAPGQTRQSIANHSGDIVFDKNGVGHRCHNELGKNLRDVWQFPTQSFKGAHFATFPEKLVRPCILAGTSEKGCCPQCGAPWVRQLSRATGGTIGKSWNDHLSNNGSRQTFSKNGTDQSDYQPAKTTGWAPSCGCSPPVVADSAIDRYGTGQAGIHRKIGREYQNWLDAHPKVTTGWNASCGCNLEPVPCTVLDPFAGAGTTGLVAQELGRHSILIDLKPEYLEMARARIEGGLTKIKGAI